MNLDLTQNVAKNLFVRWESQVPLTSRAVYLVRGNDVGMVFTKMGVAKVFVRALRAIIYYLTPQLVSWIMSEVCVCVCVCVWKKDDSDTNLVPELRLHFIPTDSIQLSLYGRPFSSFLAFTYIFNINLQSTYSLRLPVGWRTNISV